jgi:hypothetical protein
MRRFPTIARQTPLPLEKNARVKTVKMKIVGEPVDGVSPIRRSISLEC